MKPWFEIQARGGMPAQAEILIYGDIGESWRDESITAKSLVAELQGIQAKQITVRINSFGGSVPDGVAIFNALRRHGAHITTEVDAMAYSVASLIAMAGDTRRMAGNSLLMIHAPWSTAMGNAPVFRDMADLLDKHAEVMADAYARGGLPKAEALALLMDGLDHYYTADEALAAGFIDEINEAVQTSAHSRPPAGRFTPPNLPKKDTTMITDTPNPQAQRNAEIRAACAPFVNRPGFRDLQDKLIDSGLPLADVRNQLLNELGKNAQPIGGAFGGDHSGYIDMSDTRPADYLEAARDSLLMRNNVKLSRPSPMAADLARVSVVGMAESLLSMRGRSTRGMSRMEILAAASHGTSDFDNLLANTAGKALQTGYDTDPASHARWTAEREVADFKTQTLVALSAAPDLLEVVPGAEYKHGTFGEAAETFSVKTFGRLFSITRQAMVNDDLEAFTRLPAAFGASARRLEADSVYAKLTANAALSDGVALFHATHKNLLTAAVLNTASLALARAAMRGQKGPGGVGYIDPQPRFVIVPVGLQSTAEQLVNSVFEIPLTLEQGNLKWIRNLEVVADPRLDAHSATAWYLSAGPDQIDGVIRCYIAGESRPYYEQENGFTVDGLNVKARLDFGVGVVDYRGLVKNPGL